MREADPVGAEDRDLHDLIDALLAGLAGPLRPICGRAADPEQGRLSTSLVAMAEVVDAAARRYRAPGPSGAQAIAPASRRCPPSLEVVVQLERFVDATRRLAQRLREQGA